MAASGASSGSPSRRTARLGSSARPGTSSGCPAGGRRGLRSGVHRLGRRTVLEQEFVAGPTLRDRLREGPLPVETNWRWGRDLLAVLADLEAADVYHRDINPDHIVPVPADGRPELVLVDFSRSSISLGERDVGTCEYRDRQVGYGHRFRYDRAAERYTVALTLHEMVTGRLPWDDYLADYRLGPFPHRLDRELTAFFEQALHHDDARRFRSATQMREQWDRVLGSEPPRVVASPATGGLDVRTGSGRARSTTPPRIWISLLALMMVAVLAGLAASADPEPIFSDGFSGRAGNWNEINEEGRVAAVDPSEGTLVLQAERGQSLLTAPRPTPGNTSTDPTDWPATEHTRIELTATAGKLRVGTGLLVMCRYNGPADYYGVGLYGEGVTAVKVLAGTTTFLGELADPVPIDTTHLQLSCANTGDNTIQIRLSADDDELVEVEDRYPDQLARGFPLVLGVLVAPGSDADVAPAVDKLVEFFDKK